MTPDSDNREVASAQKGGMEKRRREACQKARQSFAGISNRIEAIRKELDKTDQGDAKERAELRRLIDKLIERKEKRKEVEERTCKKLEALLKAKAARGPEDAGDNLGIWIDKVDGTEWIVAGWLVGLDPGPNGKKVNWLQRLYDETAWNGGLYSGYRTPEYSEQVCYEICGAPSCSGRCAGRASKHSQKSAPGWGAIDVEDWDDFERGCIQIGCPLKNNLPSDAPHMSTTGY